MSVVFRTDASIQIGTGHVMRCLTLANELARQGSECWFVCRAHPGNLGQIIKSEGHHLILLPAPQSLPSEKEFNSVSADYASWLGVSWQEDARQTLEAISSLKPDWLVVDHYALDSNWEGSLASAVGDIMVIDDLANRPHACGLLLDQNLGRVASDYGGLLASECQQLIGPSFALLRPEFAALRGQSLERRKAPEIKRILISLGGIDRSNVTGQVLQALARSSLPASTTMDIIMGAAAPHLDDVRRQAAQLQFKTTVSVNVKDMAKRMCLADLSIGAVGGTSWERCCLGLPVIALVLADNQRNSAAALSRHGVAVIVKNSEAIRLAVDRFADEGTALCYLFFMSYAGAQLVDGNGCKRVTRYLLEKMPRKLSDY